MVVEIRFAREERLNLARLGNAVRKEFNTFSLITPESSSSA